MSSLEDKLAEIGVRQFVRNIICEVFLTAKYEDANTVITEMNRLIDERFTKLAQDESAKVWAQLEEKLAKLPAAK